MRQKDIEKMQKTVAELSWSLNLLSDWQRNKRDHTLQEKQDELSTVSYMAMTIKRDADKLWEELNDRILKESALDECDAVLYPSGKKVRGS